MATTNTKEELEAMLLGYQAMRARIDAKMEGIQACLDVPTERGKAPRPAPAKVATTAPKQKRKMTPEGRAHIVAAQKARWAKIRKASKAAA